MAMKFMDIIVAADKWNFIVDVCNCLPCMVTPPAGPCANCDSHGDNRIIRSCYKVRE